MMYMDWDTPLISHESWIGTLWVLNLFLLSSQPSGRDRSVWIEWNSNLVPFSPISSCAFTICQCTPLAALQMVVSSLCGQSCVPHPCSHCCSPSVHPSIRRANLMSHLWQSYTLPFSLSSEFIDPIKHFQTLLFWLLYSVMLVCVHVM